MGAKHPQDLIYKTGASKYDFIVACNHLIRSGVVKKPAEAIRYIEKNNCDIQEIINDMITPKAQLPEE